MTYSHSRKARSTPQFKPEFLLLPLCVRIIGGCTKRVALKVASSRSGVSSTDLLVTRHLFLIYFCLLLLLVLPPISTTGLTAADVGDLAIQTREQMLRALRDISEPTDSQPQPPPKRDVISASQAREKREQTPTPNLPSIDTAPVPLSRESDTEAEPSTPSVSSSRRDGSGSGVETEEDEGMVLVGRPDQK